MYQPIDKTLNMQYTNAFHEASATENALHNKVHITDITQFCQQKEWTDNQNER